MDDAADVTERAHAKMRATVRGFNWRYVAGVGFMALTMIPAFMIGTISMAKANEYAGAPCRGGDGRGEEYSTGAISTSLKFIGMCCLVATVSCSLCAFVTIVEWKKMMRATAQARLKMKVIAMFREFGNPCVFCMCLLVMVGVTFWVIFGLGLVTLNATLGAADDSCTDDPEEGGELYDVARVAMLMGWLYLFVLGGQMVLVVMLYRKAKKRVTIIDAELDSIDTLAVAAP